MPNDSTAFLCLLNTFDIRPDDESPWRAFDFLLPLCRQYRLTSYDAAYLELTVRRRLPVATLDDDLRTAAITLGLPVLGK